MSNGKGSTPRPLSVTPDTYAANYARIKWTEDTAADLRDKHLDEAKDAITNAPPMSDHTKAHLARLWAIWDASHPDPQ